jgi:hypothetical protein
MNDEGGHARLNDLPTLDRPVIALRTPAKWGSFSSAEKVRGGIASLQPFGLETAWFLTRKKFSPFWKTINEQNARNPVSMRLLAGFRYFD